MKKIGILLILGTCFTSALSQSKQIKNYAGWHKLCGENLRGANTEAARIYMGERWFGTKKNIVVGVIDSGIDTTLESVRPALWSNPKEKPDGKDNDGNGYVDDLHGWNFLGTADGTFNMTSAGTQEFREFKRLYPKYKHVNAEEMANNAEYQYYLAMRKAAGINGYLRAYAFAQQKAMARHAIDSIAQAMPGIDADTMCVTNVMRLDVNEPRWESWVSAQIADIVRSGGSMTWAKFKQRQQAALQLMQNRIASIERDIDKRTLMGDNMNDASDIHYGNNTLTVDGCEHGTFVAGIIAGQTPDDKRYEGICPEAKIMTIRICPDGDEYDKDVSTAIRYAVDNGAKVINMSFGKYTSPQADMVNDAIAYAARHDALIVQAAGNDHKDIDRANYFPTAVDKQGRRFDNYIRVGATDMHGHASKISNYGARNVDIFAPGEYIASVFPGNKKDLSQGTSLAAPVVAGVAAMIRCYFPRLTATEVKHILMESASRMDEQGLSVCNGIVDALAAVKMARKYK
jgi:hypothetical protein